MKFGAELLRYSLNVAAYQIWEGLVDNFSVHKHYKLEFIQTDRKTTDDRHDFFKLQIFSPSGPNFTLSNLRVNPTADDSFVFSFSSNQLYRLKHCPVRSSCPNSEKYR